MNISFFHFLWQSVIMFYILRLEGMSSIFADNLDYLRWKAKEIHQAMEEAFIQISELFLQTIYTLM